MSRREGGVFRAAIPWVQPAVRSAVAAGNGAAGALRDAAPSLAWLLARARTMDSAAPYWRQWVATGAGLPEDAIERWPAGPCVAALQVGAMSSSAWACARAVHLLTALDHLQFPPADALDLDAGELEQLRVALNAELAALGLELQAAVRGVWPVRCSEPLDCTCVEPIDAGGRSLRDVMPGGPDGRKVRRIVNEVQMLLHEHPFNVRRLRAGQLPVNTLWFWGFGVARAADERSCPPLVTDDAWLAGLWSLHGNESLDLGDAPLQAVAAETAQQHLAWSIAPPGLDPLAALEAAERRVFAPLRNGLVQGSIGAAEAHLGSCAFTIERGARFKFWRGTPDLAEMLK